MGVGLLSPTSSYLLSLASRVWLPLLGSCLALGDQHQFWFNQAEHLKSPLILPEPLAISERTDALVSLPLGSILPSTLLGESSGEGRGTGSPLWLWWECRLNSLSVPSAR